jgi:hypothetical protein
VVFLLPLVALFLFVVLFSIVIPMQADNLFWLIVFLVLFSVVIPAQADNRSLAEASSPKAISAKAITTTSAKPTKQN